MDKWLKEKISLVSEAQQTTPIHKGFSSDKKFVVDDRYLIRLFRSEGKEERHKEFQTIKKLANYSEFVPKAVEFDTIPESDYAYMVLTYLPGVDGEIALNQLTEIEQYAIGVKGGKELKKLHELKAPPTVASWYKQKKMKSDDYLNKLTDIPVKAEIVNMLTTYIHANEHLMKQRPNTFQHDDFHPANLLINDRNFSGIIDFQRIDWGDPLHDLTKTGFFTVRISIPFSKGIIDGYFLPNKPSAEFWQLYSLYGAMHVVSSLVWGFRLGEEHFKRLKSYSMDVIIEHQNFTTTIPQWYKKENFKIIGGELNEL